MPGAADLRRAAALAGALLLAACGGEPGSGGAGAGRQAASPASAMPRGAKSPARAGARLARRVEPVDLLPEDLDLVARIDVGRMRAGLGPAAVAELEARALADMPDEALRGALERADVVWLAVRLADLDEGDRIVIVEGKMEPLAPDPDRWQPVPTGLDGVVVLDRRGPTPRYGIARVVALGDRALAFVSPVEVGSIGRVLRDGPDERRGDPAADGIVSLDLHAHRLPPRLERRFPSIGAIIAGVERVRAVATLSDAGVRLEAQIVGAQPAGAERARRFIEALRDNVKDPFQAGLMKALSIEQVERTVQIRWLLPSSVVLSLLSRDAPG